MRGDSNPPRATQRHLSATLIQMRRAALIFGIVAILTALAISGLLTGRIATTAAILIAFETGRRLRNARDPRDTRRIDALSHPSESPPPVTSDTGAAPHAASAVASAPSARDDRRDLDNGVSLVCDVSGAAAGILWRVETSGQIARAVGVHGITAPQPRTIRGDPLGWVAREGTTLRLDTPPVWAPPGSDVVALRLRKTDYCTWLLTLAFEHDALIMDYARLDAVAAPLRLLVELQERRSETDTDRRRLNNLLDILHRIPVATELAAAGDELVAACMQLTGATGGALGIWENDLGRIVTVRGDDGGPLHDAIFQSPTSELALAVRSGGPLVRLPGSWKPGPTQIANASDRWVARPRTFAAVPLATSNGITSVVVVWNTNDSLLDTVGVQLIRTIAPYAALHLQHARDFGQLKETAETDALTGLRNRRAFDAAVALEASRYDRYARPLSLLLLDLDHFKAVNDTYGHEGGDAVLRKVADIVRNCVRDVDTAARFGGEELAVLLPETLLASAREVAERIRLTIASTPVPWGDTSIRVTVSIGMSTVPETVDAVAGLLTNADEALYTAKRGGRNRVVSGAEA
jgi:diguanylate cyclase (GGDEF)-like protein